MSVIQISPCILNEDWAGFVEWCSRAFDMPVACRFDEQGWGRLSAPSQGITVISNQHFRSSSAGESTVVELEVTGVESHVRRAVEAGAELITEPEELAENLMHASLRTPQGIVLWLLQAVDSGDSEINDGPINFTVEQTISAPLPEVFAAATQAETLEKFFVSEVSGDLDAETDLVTWGWDGYGEGDLNVIEFRPNEHVAFHWKADRQSYHTRTQFSFTSQGDGTTRIAITESGWNADPRGLKSAFGHCEGWTTFANNLKLLLEHGVESM